MGFVARLTALDVARLTDKRTEMKERLASAVEFAGVGAADPILQRQIQDAGEHAGNLHLAAPDPAGDLQLGEPVDETQADDLLLVPGHPGEEGLEREPAIDVGQAPAGYHLGGVAGLGRR